MVTLRALARDAVDLGKDTLAEPFERERMHARSTFQSGSVISRNGFPCSGALKV